MVDNSVDRLIIGPTGQTIANPNYKVAQRIVNAEERFLEMVQDTIGCSRTDAEKVLSVYRKEKVVKIDMIGGQFTLKHGVFAEPDVLNNAVTSPD